MIFEKQVSRKPDHYAWTHRFKDAIQDNPWTVKKFTFQSDIQDFKTKFNDQEREMVTKSLATIGQLEISVKRFWSKLGDNLPHPSFYDLGFVFSANEVVHGDAYEKLLESLGIEDAFDNILKLDIIKGRVNYLEKHLHKFHADNRKQFVYSLILFTIFIENISLFSQFYTISWFGKYQNSLKDANKQVNFTSFEETVHYLAGVQIINQIRQEHPELFDEELEKKVLQETESAVEYECQIIKWIIGDFNHKKLDVDLLQNFIKNRLNDSLSAIGYRKIFEINQEELAKTIWFDELVLGNSSQDFFVNTPVEYAKNSQSFSEDDLF